MRRRMTALFAAATMVMLGSCASASGEVVADDPGLIAPLPSTTLAATTTVRPRSATTVASAPTTVVATVPTTTLPPLPTPSAPPLERGAPGPLLGSVDIPRIGLSLPLFDGVNLATLDEGPGHWPGTARPGELGNAVVAAHRVSHGGPFRKIDALVPGDEVRFTVDGKATLYNVVANEVVKPEGIHIIEQTNDFTATLFACHPPGSTKYRYVVKLRLAGTAPPPPAA